MRRLLGLTRDDVLDALALGGALWVMLFLVGLVG
jgi:hypothetical protein